MQNLKGIVVAVTGASGGIGKGIALKLAENGVKVVLGARSAEQLMSVVEEIDNAGGEAISVTIDVSKKADLIKFVDRAVAAFGKLDVIINNAGVAHISPIAALDTEGWDEMIDITSKVCCMGWRPQFLYSCNSNQGTSLILFLLQG